MPGDPGHALWKRDFLGASSLFGVVAPNSGNQSILVKYGTEAQKANYLPRMARGEIITAIAMSEPGVGSDLQSVKTSAVKDGEGYYTVNGSKTFITNGWNADLVITVAKTNPALGAKGTSLILVERGMPGFKATLTEEQTDAILARAAARGANFRRVDDTTLARTVWPPLTTIRHPKAELGLLAVQQLVSRIRNKELEVEFKIDKR